MGIRKYVGDLHREVDALALATRDTRTPRHARVLAFCVVALAISPIDPIPDMIPVLGHVDDAILIPVGALAVRRLIPEHVMTDCRTRAAEREAESTRGRWVVGALIVLSWVVVIAAVVNHFGWLPV